MIRNLVRFIECFFLFDYKLKRLFKVKQNVETGGFCLSIILSKAGKRYLHQDDESYFGRLSVGYC